VPLYEYKCLKCGRRTEKIESVNGPHLKKCPHCGGKVESMISAPAIQFKGSGWYVTDYAGKSSGGDKGEKSKDKDEKSPSEKKDSASKDSSSKDSGSKDSASKESSSSSSDKKSEKAKKK
jgi:putative FmdB family regulatory protein